LHSTKVYATFAVFATFRISTVNSAFHTTAPRIWHGKL